jgi:hypothetical protein
MVAAVAALPGCVVPGAHLQAFRVINDSADVVTVDWTLDRRIGGAERYETAFQGHLVVNASSWADAWPRFSNGEYRLVASADAGHGKVDGGLPSIRFGDVGVDNVDPNNDPRHLFMWWNGTALRVEGCTSDGCSVPPGITRQA